MKTNITIFTILFVLILCACQKEKPVQKELELTDFTITPASTIAQVSVTVAYPGKLTATLKVSQSEDMTNAAVFVSEKTTTDDEPYSFCITATNLQGSTDYWCQVEVNNTFISKKTEIKRFSTLACGIKVTTSDVYNIQYSTATCDGTVTTYNGTSVSSRGICWSTSHNPTANGSHANSGSGTGSFTAYMTGLMANTTYYVRAFATNSQGTSYGNEVSFTTSQYVSLPTVTTANITNIAQTTATGGGNVTSTGNALVTARGVCWSTLQNPTISNSHSTDGTGTGGFTSSMTGLTANTTYYVRAYATNSAGTSYGNEVSFTTTSPPQVPTGAINGLFTINDNGDQVWFSKGNLQYQATTQIWRFAENQWDMIGEANANISSSYSGWIDLFGFGTSGWNSGAVCYYPWATSEDPYDYFVGGSGNNSLTGNYENADWGVYNPITNGGNQSHEWRTLTVSELRYLIEFRNSALLKRSQATVNGVHGLILLPDTWTLPQGLTFVCDANNWTSNTYSQSQWLLMESSGAIFLPAAGSRSSTSIVNVDRYGTYCSSSAVYGSLAYYLRFGITNSNSIHEYIYTADFYRDFGYSVRLVQDY